jgi:hypothetical protein
MNFQSPELPSLRYGLTSFTERLTANFHSYRHDHVRARHEKAGAKQPQAPKKQMRVEMRSRINDIRQLECPHCAVFAKAAR